jgi:N-acetyl-anhydromuramyl-L-alanine amidase AmpD
MIPDKIIIHHTATTAPLTIRKLDQWHHIRFNFPSSLSWYVGYHYVIFRDGAVVQTRRDNELGAHSPPNLGKIGIALEGNFDIVKPTDAQIISLSNLVGMLKKLYNIENVLGHRDCNKTECPGTELYKWVLLQKISWLKSLIAFLTSKLKTNV